RLPGCFEHADQALLCMVAMSEARSQMPESQKAPPRAPRERMRAERPIAAAIGAREAASERPSPVAQVALATYTASVRAGPSTQDWATANEPMTRGFCRCLGKSSGRIRYWQTLELV